jgi:hypothetical protein
VVIAGRHRFGLFGLAGFVAILVLRLAFDLASGAGVNPWPCKLERSSGAWICTGEGERIERAVFSFVNDFVLSVIVVAGIHAIEKNWEGMGEAEDENVPSDRAVMYGALARA